MEDGGQMKAPHMQRNCAVGVCEHRHGLGSARQGSTMFVLEPHGAQGLMEYKK